MIYLDNAATSFPKPPAVGEQMKYFTDFIGANMNRSVYGKAQETGFAALELREALAGIFNSGDPTHVIITSGATLSLNMAIRGYLRPGDHCLCSSMEHNAVMRPLNGLEKHGVTFTRIPCSGDGYLEPEDIKKYIRPNTRLFVMAHASNVSGTVQNAEAIGRILSAAGIPFVLDASQSAGHIPVDFKSFGLSALALPGHKGLMGPAGIGALILRRDFADMLEPIITGGTGSQSDREEQPLFMPDRFESGTANLPGIFGLNAALKFMETTGLENIIARERQLTEQFILGLEKISGAVLIGPQSAENRLGVISLDFPKLDNAEVSDILEGKYGILTRCGLHCAPSAHKTLGTFPRGTVRFSLGLFNTEDDIAKALAAIGEIAK